jgi:hypothetical protein
MDKNTFIKFALLILFCFLITLELYSVKNTNTLYSYLINLLFYLTLPFIFYQSLISNKVNYSIIIIFILVIDLVSFRSENQLSYLSSISTDILVFINMYLLYYVHSNFNNKEGYSLKNNIISTLRDLDISKLIFFKL